MYPELPLDDAERVKECIENFLIHEFINKFLDEVLIFNSKNMKTIAFS